MMPRVVAAVGFFLLLRIVNVADAQTVTYFQVPGVLWGIAVGPDGNVWFPTVTGVGKMTPSGNVTTYLSPRPQPMAARAMITAGGDGRMWYTYNDRICAVTMDGVITEYSLPPNTSATAIALGADDNVWFSGGVGVGRITPQGQVAVFATDKPRSWIPEMATGADGNVWFVLYPEPYIGKVTPEGQVAIFSVPLGGISIANATDGGVWVGSNLSVSGALTRYSANGTVASSLSVDRNTVVIRSGPEAIMWFGTQRSGIATPPAIGRISTNGDVQLFDLPFSIPRVMDMVAGPDGNIWATLYPTPHDSPSASGYDPTALPELSIARVNLSAPAAVPALSFWALCFLVVCLGAIGFAALRPV